MIFSTEGDFQWTPVVENFKVLPQWYNNHMVIVEKRLTIGLHNHIKLPRQSGPNMEHPTEKFENGTTFISNNKSEKSFL